ncbi:MAG: HEPN domain-containing protein [Mariprofundaceae bacterium]|nr:HEPN domain-containing protein [Mariprofundaceae bacterium]
MITSDDLLTLSKGLLCDSEVKNRAAVSRAYYSSFHAIKTLASSKLNYSPPSGDDRKSPHWHLCEYLIDQNDANISEVGSELRKLSRRRKTADYKLNATITKQDSTLLVAMASTLIGTSKNVFAKKKTSKNSGTH